jgi:hypothetical protein
MAIKGLRVKVKDRTGLLCGCRFALSIVCNWVLTMNQTLFASSVFFCTAIAAHAAEPRIPKVWDDTEIASAIVPLAIASATPVQIPSKYYYGIPVRTIYKSYPVYRPDREPAGYLEWLKKQEPEIAFDAAKLKTPEDWIRAGELVFDAPISYGHIFRLAPSDLYLRDPDWYRSTGAPLLKDGSLPFYRYVIRQKGKVEIGVNSCGMCHTRVMPDGTTIKGAQGNFPFDRAFAWEMRNPSKLLGPLTSLMARRVSHMLYSAPWLHPDAYPELDGLGWAGIAERHEAVPPGVLSRHGTSPHAPAKVPDLIGIEGRRYFDATGLMHHRDIGDLMRYAAMNQDGDVLSRYGSFVPAEVLPFILGKVPADPAKRTDGRYSDEQLYALAVFLYSLAPPANPNRPDLLTAAGRKVFEREGCAGCHNPPLYTNNKRTPVVGYRPSPGDPDVLAICVGTDPTLAMKSRRGTGYYKVPSLKGVWYRGPFEHSGSVATLEDWFDARRLHDDYVPTGFKGYGVTTRAVKGHEFGLTLTPGDRKALIAFLKTL